MSKNKYTVFYSKTALKQLKKMNKEVSSLIIGYIEKNIINTESPYSHGKSLSANRKDQWRYRIGKYRIIFNINDNELIILVIEIGHRKEIYK